MYQPFFEIENPQPPRKKESLYEKKYIINTITIGIFLLILILGWLEARLICYFDLPSDCRRNINTWDIYLDISNILQKGSVLILISNLTENFTRIVNKLTIFIYIFLFFITGPLFALAGELPGMQTSLSTFKVGFNASFITYLSCLIFTLLSLTYELYKILRYYGKIYIFSYGFSRCLIVLYYVIFAFQLAKYYPIHIHHLYIGFIIGCFAHDHKLLSWLSLSIGSGIMVQGIGSYHYATIIQD